MALHIGAQYRFATSYDGTTGNQLSTHAFYPMLRLEASQTVFISIGATPLLLIRDGVGYGFDGLARPAGAFAFMADVGYNFRITPSVSIIVYAGGQTALSGGGLSPRPNLESAALMRFWIDAADDFSATEERKRGNSQYEGWRYPYGREK